MAVLSVLQMSAQCDTTGQKISVSAQPTTVLAGLSIQLVAEPPATIPPVAAVRLSAYVDGQRATILRLYFRQRRHPVARHVLARGTYTAWFYLDMDRLVPLRSQSPRGKETLIRPWTRQIRIPARTVDLAKISPVQDGDRRMMADVTIRTADTAERSLAPNATSSTERSQDCPTVSVVIGPGYSPYDRSVSHMYLDYCSDKRMMYLLNDWLIGSGSYKQNCYNVFEFTTGNGSEQWKIKVTHDSARPVIVVLNGADVTDDTTLVPGGGFGLGASPSDTTLPYHL
ncbi:MAG: hypothetical protein IPM83_07995 [Ignavibacteria bacterium]|nr:hypothetical protein [Ignavibacteria bacterium]